MLLTLPSALLLSVTDLPLAKSATTKEKMSRLPWHFYPSYSPCQAYTQPCHFYPSCRLTARHTTIFSPCQKNRLQKENVIKSMERKHRLSIIHVPLCRYLQAFLSPPTPKTWPRLALLSSFSPCYLCLGLTSVFYHIATHIYTLNTQHPFWKLKSAVVTTEPKIFR